jgi:transcriptional regulator with XRE-family HTH domain
MTVSDRIRIILKEKNLNQKKFAKSIYVTEGYISRLLRGSIGISNSTAMLIEKIHGYAKDWVLRGQEPKMAVPGTIKELTPLQRKIIEEIEFMTDDELFFIQVYLEALKKKKGLKETNREKG